MTERSGSRVNFDVTDALYKRIQEIPYGMRSEVLRSLITRAIDAADKSGELVYGAIIGGDFELQYQDKAAKKR